MENFTTPSKIIIKSAKKLLDGRSSQKRSETSAAELPATADVINEMTKEVKKTSEDTPRSSEAESNPLVHSGFCRPNEWQATTWLQHATKGY